MKNTKQKEAVIEAVRSMKNHPTADEIYQNLRRDNDKISLGTVYRNLNRFSQMGWIKKVDVPGFGDRFDFRTDDHEHMLCEKCGRVFDANIKITIEPSEGVEFTSYKLMLYGTCGECKIQSL